MSLSILWLIFFYGWFALEIYVAVATRTRRSSGNVLDRGTLRLLWAVIASSITACIWISAVKGQTMPGAPEVYRIASLSLLILALVLRWAAIFTLGKSFSANVAIHSTQTVMKTGLYGWMRHPSYTGLLMCFLAIGLHYRNWVSLLIIVAGPTAALLYRIHVEEGALREHFGQEYVEYCRETKRLIPGIY